LVNKEVSVTVICVGAGVRDS